MRIKLVARVIQTIVLCPILIFIALRLQEHMVAGTTGMFVCLFGGDWLREMVVDRVMQGRGESKISE